MEDDETPYNDFNKIKIYFLPNQNMTKLKDFLKFRSHPNILLKLVGHEHIQELSPSSSKYQQDTE